MQTTFYIPLSSSQQDPISNLSPINHPPDYNGPRTQSAASVVSKHVRSFYRLVAIVGILFIMSIFHSLVLMIAFSKRNTCTGKYKNLPMIVMIITSTDLAISIMFIFFIIGHIIWCYQRSRLVYYCLGIAIIASSLFSYPITMIITEGQAFYFMFSSNTPSSFNDYSSCDNSIRYIITIISIYKISTIFVLIVYSNVMQCKQCFQRPSGSPLRFLAME